ncbi:hypothetical protein ACUH94_00830 [Dermabacteraceae bacterium P7074]
MNKANLEIETFILKDTGVSFLEVFASRHDKQLASIATSPDEAAQRWH